MKILTMMVKFVLSIVFILLCSFLATFFLTVFMPENVLNAIEIFKNLLQIP